MKSRPIARKVVIIERWIVKVVRINLCILRGLAMHPHTHAHTHTHTRSRIPQWLHLAVVALVPW